MNKISIAVHGGAGTILRSNMTDSLQKEYEMGLTEAISKGYNVMAGGGSSLDAVAAAVASLEGFPL